MIAAMSLEMAMAMLPGLVIGITVHEFAHAWSASLLGDDFPRRQGRVSLNPLRHLSPLGTLAILLLPIGWGRPVVVNLFNFRRPKLDYLLSSLAGPLANLITAAICMLAMLWTRRFFQFGRAGVLPLEGVHLLLGSIFLVNILLATLNLLPIPPLDGSKIWPCLIPGARPGVSRKTTWVFLAILLALVTTGSLNAILDRPVGLAMSLLPEADAERVFVLDHAAEQALRAGQYDVAESSASEQLAIDRESYRAYYVRAQARAWLGNWPGAMEDVNQAIALDPAEAAYYDFRASVFTALGQESDADRDRETAGLLRSAWTGLPAAPDSQPAHP